jgi:hypothetical protein
MTDYIATLPVDNEPIPPDENKLLDQILHSNTFQFQTLLNDFKLPLLVGVLFLLICNPSVKAFMTDSIPYAQKSETSLLIVQALFLVVLVYLVLNLSSIMKP